ncbi:MAG: DUF7079 family protein [Bdellovibrio sp.]
MAASTIIIPLLLVTLVVWIVALIASPRAPDSFATEERKRVWTSLSELYLDTELSDYEISSIADVIKKSGFSRDEAWQILETEVGPICISNLFSTAGEWEEGALSGSWLKASILGSQPAALCVRRIPLIGFLLARFVTFGVRGKFQTAVDEAFPSEY